MTFACIADASVVLKTVLGEQDSDAAERWLRANPPAAPAIAHVEFANVLRRLVKSRLRTKAQALESLRLLVARVPAIPETPAQIERTFELALELDHAATDCRYLAAAQSLGLPLVTADTAFARKARTKGHDVRTL